MAPLAEVQQAFADAVLAPERTAHFVAGDRAVASARIAIYRNAIFANYRRALSATYPVVRRLIGAPMFDDIVFAFVRAHPSTCGDLNVYGDALHRFLSAYAPLSDRPYLADVARLEWAVDEASRASDCSRAADAVLAAMSAVAPERLPALRLTLDPSCRLLTSAYPILRIWNDHQDDTSTPDVVIDGRADAVLVRRDPQGVVLERIAAGEHAWLDVLAAGGTLEAAIDAAQSADSTFDLAMALRAHVGAGTIIGVSVSPVAAD
jgi:hypothetical protein